MNAEKIKNMVDQDRKAVTSKRASLSIWAQEFESDAEAVQAFLNQATKCESFDYQLSQFVRRYFLKNYGVVPSDKEDVL